MYGMNILMAACLAGTAFSQTPLKISKKLDSFHEQEDNVPPS